MIIVSPHIANAVQIKVCFSNDYPARAKNSLYINSTNVY